MMLDLRLPIGLFFLVVGAILTVSGVIHPVVEQGISLSRDWGVVLLIFGAFMTLFGWRAMRQEPAV